MIKRIFWDIDETLIHTAMYEPNQEHKMFMLPDGVGKYYTIFRPCACDLIEFSRALVGKENVFILTSATRDYAHIINQLGNFGFDEKNIFTREDLRDNLIETAWGGYATIANEAIADRDNVIIDNLHPRHNETKVSYIGIKHDRYLKIRDYYGVNAPQDPFEEQVKEFLTKAHNE